MCRYTSFFIVILLFSCNTSKKIKKDNQLINESSLTEIEAIKIKDKTYRNYRENLLVDRLNEMEKRTININNREMKFDLKFFGDKPISGWKLYFQLHGGGGVPDSINEKEWIRNQTLHKVKDGIILIPRSPTNTWNMWHQAHIDSFLNHLIQNMIAFHDVNPNRIYLMGRSAGGDGVYQLSNRMADRFAATATMAGHPNDASPLGLRNIGFTIHMGAKDTAYNRNEVAIEWGEKLKSLKDDDPNGYSHWVQIYKEKGHWVDGLDSSAIGYITQFNRNPYPKKVVWKQDDVTQDRFYWLRSNDPIENSLIIVSINDQTITIEETTIPEFIIMLNDDMIDMDKRIIVKYKEIEIFSNIVLRNVDTIEKSIQEYGDYKSVYSGEIFISINNEKDNQMKMK
tara:strand:- start:958 stop:2148 length:1191 start_codon:yes stop_codon:yes gene_type:complete